MPILEHHATGRTRRAAAVVVCVWVGSGVLWAALDAAPWIVAIPVLATLPAVWDFVTARPAGMRLSDDGIAWWSGRHRGDVALHRLSLVRFETRMDLSIRVRLVLDSGRRITLPPDALPPWSELQAAFETRGIRTERHHFSLL